MNQAEKKAREFYERNKKFIENSINCPISLLMGIAKQQDAYYKVFNFRADNKMRANHDR